MTFLVCLINNGDSISASNNPSSYFNQAFGFTPRGDSSSIFGQSWCTYYGTNMIARNLAFAGARLNSGGVADLVPIAPTVIDPMPRTSYSGGANRRYIFVTTIGSNDSAIGELSDPPAYAAAVATACVARKTAGYHRALMATILPRGDVSIETNRASFNSTIMSGAWQSAHGIDGVIDIASEPTMGNVASCSNATYYEQVAKIHPTAAGHALLAPIYLAAVNAVIAGLT